MAMPQFADAIVTGFVKSPSLLRRSLAPLLQLKQEGVLRSITCVTWDAEEIDAHVAPLADIPEISLMRVPQPVVQGTANQRGVAYQIRNLDVALSRVPGEDPLILKLRPDVVVDVDFLRGKIADFDRLCTVPDEQSPLGVKMPKPILNSKIWIPWADSNQPFFYEDAMFLARKKDLRKLVTALSPDDLEILADPLCGQYAHVVRYARIFLPRYGLFANYLRNYRYFPNDFDYRVQLVPHLLQDGFFWHALVAHAWILHSQFHVDAGRQGEISFYANNVNQNADWSNLETLRNAPPYDYVDKWREGTKPDQAMWNVRRTYGRLTDDAWQAALFTRELPDLPQATLKKLLENIAGCRDGRLRGIESDFYRDTAALYDRLWCARNSNSVQSAA
jgi:hypothetical protein